MPTSDMVEAEDEDSQTVDGAELVPASAQKAEISKDEEAPDDASGEPTSIESAQASVSEDDVEPSVEPESSAEPEPSAEPESEMSYGVVGSSVPEDSDVQAQEILESIESDDGHEPLVDAAHLTFPPPPAVSEDVEGRDILNEAKERFREQKAVVSDHVSGAGAKAAVGGPNKWSKVSQDDVVFGRARPSFKVESSQAPVPKPVSPTTIRSVHIRPKQNRKPFVALVALILAGFGMVTFFSPNEPSQTSAKIKSPETVQKEEPKRVDHQGEDTPDKVSTSAAEAGDKTHAQKSVSEKPKVISPVDEKEARRHYLAGNQFLNENRVEDSIKSLELAITENPHFGLAFRSLGIAYMRAGNIEQAVSFYQRFVELEPEHADTPEVKKVIAKYQK
jgi:hypothetical protein